MYLLMFGLLLVPFLNLLVGAVLGLVAAGRMLSTRRFARLFGLAPVAGVWFACAVLQLLALNERGAEPFVLSTVPLAVVTAVFLWLVVTTGATGVTKQIEKANAEGKGTFELTFKSSFGHAAEGVVVLFDARTRHVAFVTEKTCRVEPFWFIKGWELEWKENSRNASASDVRMKIKTMDFENPVLHVWLPNKAAGEVWAERLDDLLDHRGDEESAGRAG